MSHREFHSKIAGVTHGQGGVNPQQLLKRCRSGQLELIRDPRNKYDKNAIKVCLPTGEQLGWINRELTKELSELIDNGTRVSAEISEVTGGTLFKPERGCNIIIAYEEDDGPPA
jgi:hypothetical protein